MCRRQGLIGLFLGWYHDPLRIFGSSLRMSSTRYHSSSFTHSLSAKNKDSGECKRMQIQNRISVIRTSTKIIKSSNFQASNKSQVWQQLHQQFIISFSLRFLGRLSVSCGLLLAGLLFLGAVLESLLPLLLEVLPPLGLLLSLLGLLLLGQLFPFLLFILLLDKINQINV